MKFFFIVIIAAAVAGCATPSANGGLPIDQMPMYGGMDRGSVTELKTADEKLIEDTTREFGSREKASLSFVNRGFQLYQQNDLVGAMRRFNQAWILNPGSPDVYWGFASILTDQGKNCEAMKMMDKALGFDRYIPGLYPDAGRIIVLCTVFDPALTIDQKNRNFDRSDALYAEAVQKDINKGYIFSSWATAYYWRGKYAEAWQMVTKARETGVRMPDRFMTLLREKMPEPK